MPIIEGGRIPYTDFIMATINRKVFTEEDKIFQAFKFFDRDNDGLINEENLVMAFNHGGVPISS